jgi:hypothetical protein
MNASGAYYELAKTMIADRVREAEHNCTAAQLRAAQRDETESLRPATRSAVRSGATITSRVRAVLRSRTA